MSADQLPTEEIDAEFLGRARAMAVLVIARLIGAGKIIPSRIRSKKKFRELTNQLGRSSDYAFEIHIDYTEERINSIKICLESGDPQSAILLLHTLIESETNTAVRILLRISGYSNSEITDAIKGIDLKSKLDVLLPLLGVQPSREIRQLRSESQNIRNSIVHFKATPIISTDDEEQIGDHDIIFDKANNFFRSHSIESIQSELSRFLNVCVSQSPELKAAHALLQRFSA